LVALGICAVGGFALFEVALSGLFVWISLTAALICVALYVRHSRLLAARDLAVADAPSFADVLRERKARDAVGLGEAPPDEVG